MKILTYVTSVIFSFVILSTYLVNVVFTTFHIHDVSKKLLGAKEQTQQSISHCIKKTNNGVLNLKGKHDVERELQEALDKIFLSYLEVKHLIQRPAFTLSVILPDASGANEIPETVKKIIKNTLSYTFPSSPGSSIVSFTLTTRNTKDANGIIQKQKMKVEFSFPDDAPKVLMDSNKVHQDDESDPKMIHWKFENETKHGRRIRRSIVNSANYSFDFNDPNWKNIRASIRKELSAQEKKKQKHAYFTINIRARPYAVYDDWLIMTKHMDDAIRQIVRKRNIKYLAEPHLRDVRQKKLKLDVLVTPVYKPLKKENKLLKKICKGEIIPRLKKEHPQLDFKYESIFNAVDTTQQKVSDNTARLVLRVFNRENRPKISPSKMKEIFDNLKDKYPQINFSFSHNELDLMDPDKEYLILTFQVQSIPEDDYDKKTATTQGTYETKTPKYTSKGPHKTKMAKTTSKGSHKHMTQKTTPKVLGKKNTPKSTAMETYKNTASKKKQLASSVNTEGYHTSDNGTNYKISTQSPVTESDEEEEDSISENPALIDDVSRTITKISSTSETFTAIYPEHLLGRANIKSNESSNPKETAQKTTSTPDLALVDGKSRTIIDQLTSVEASVGTTAKTYRKMDNNTDIDTSNHSSIAKPMERTNPTSENPTRTDEVSPLTPTKTSTMITTKNDPSRENIIVNESSTLSAIIQSIQEKYSTLDNLTMTHEVSEMITKPSVPIESSTIIAQGYSTMITTKNDPSRENIIVNESSTLSAVIQSIQEKYSTPDNLTMTHEVSEMITKPSVPIEISTIVAQGYSIENNVKDNGTSTNVPQSDQEKGWVSKDATGTATDSKMITKPFTPPETTTADPNFKTENSSTPGNLSGTEEVSQITTKSSTSTEISIITSEGLGKENATNNESLTLSSASVETSTIFSTEGFPGKGNIEDDKNSTISLVTNLDRTGEVSEIITKPSILSENFTTIAKKNASEVDTIIHNTLPTTEYVFISTTPLTPQATDLTSTNLPWTAGPTVLIASKSTNNSFVPDTSSCPIQTDGSGKTIEINTPEGKYVQKILDKNILPILRAFYPSRKLKSSVCRKEEKFPGICNTDTFKIEVGIVGEGFRPATLTFIKNFLMKLPETYPNLTAACVSPSDKNLELRTNMTLCIKVAKLNETCTIPEHGVERVCCEDDTSAVVPAGGLPPSPDAMRAVVPSGGTPPLRKDKGGAVSAGESPPQVVTPGHSQPLVSDNNVPPGGKH